MIETIGRCKMPLDSGHCVFYHLDRTANCHCSRRSALSCLLTFVRANIWQHRTIYSLTGLPLCATTCKKALEKYVGGFLQCQVALLMPSSSTTLLSSSGPPQTRQRLLACGLGQGCTILPFSLLPAGLRYATSSPELLPRQCSAHQA